MKLCFFGIHKYKLYREKSEKTVSHMGKDWFEERIILTPDLYKCEHCGKLEGLKKEK